MILAPKEKDGAVSLSWFASVGVKNIDPGEVEIPEGFLHIKETATVGMEMLYQSLRKLSQRT